MTTPTAQESVQDSAPVRVQGVEPGQFEVSLPGVFAAHMEGTDDIEGTNPVSPEVLALRAAWARAVVRSHGKTGSSWTLYCRRPVLEVLARHAKTVIELGGAAFSRTEIDAAHTALRRIRALIDLPR